MMKTLQLAILAIFVSAANAQANDASYAPIRIDGTQLNRAEQYISESGVALHGYDTVAYHSLGEATPGRADISATYNDALWFFSTQAHRAAFLADPARYGPAYDGHCAFAAAHGARAAGNPLNWTIIDGQLFLNVNPNAHRLFLEDAENFIDRGVAYWNDTDEPLSAADRARPLSNVRGEVTAD
ncbi:YHS domain-containing (seleno)protein [Hyphobacterium sp.]|uniref:YHS domain-containing (seleno)protein n=1 Tax=Hyphobacterium sp. TaxID=2004662 RepID=UPI003BAC9D13